MSDQALIEERLGHQFSDVALLETALSHASYASETDGSRGNERLEFLGDAVLDLVVSRFLYDNHREWSEGELTRTRASLVKRDSLAACARELGLGGVIQLGRGERLHGGSEKDTILADCLEALLGALFLDGGLEPVERIVRQMFGSRVEIGSEAVQRDPKTEFQERAHAIYRVTPRYNTVNDTGDESDENRFTVEVEVEGSSMGRGVGRSKRLAERAAARSALATVRENHD
ncbi:ribonuclease III [Myxococcota bacterium]|nr:ribonuclease III [Myxococcota bacterium]